MKRIEKKDKDYHRRYFLLYYFTILMFFFTLYMLLISNHSTELIKKPIQFILAMLFVGNILLNIYCIYKMDKYPKQTSNIKRKIANLALIIFIIPYIGLSTLFMFKVYCDKDFKTWLINSAMTSFKHQYYAYWFYSKDEIKAIRSSNITVEAETISNPDLIKFNTQNKNYKNEFDKEVLTREYGQPYKIININRKINNSIRNEGKLAVIYDPSTVVLASSKYAGKTLRAKGQYVTDMSRDHDAYIGINGGGFYDPDWNSMGGYPHGLVFSFGKLIFDNRKAGFGGLIGFDKHHRLVLGNYTTQQAINLGIRDAVEFGPFLIVNGKRTKVYGDGGWGRANRTVIGQRDDGIVLMLVLDGRRSGVPGASIKELIDIMADYGAINAACMDGGTSSSMTENGKIITHPRNSSGHELTRPIPNAWLALEKSPYKDETKEKKNNKEEIKNEHIKNRK